MRMYKTTCTYEDGTKVVQIAPYIDMSAAILDFNYNYPTHDHRVIRCDCELDETPDRTVRYIRDYVLNLTITDDDMIQIRDLNDCGRLLASGKWYEDYILTFMSKRVFKMIKRENMVKVYIIK